MRALKAILLAYSSFNPSLVRLAHHHLRPGAGQDGAFNPSLVRLAPLNILGMMGRRCLSIPAWFDWRRERALARLIVSCLSIPAWFDWRPAAPLPPRPAGLAFNPSLVRLARVGEVA